MNKKLSATGAAAFVRKSAKHQSTGDQMGVIRKFAKRRGLIIVKVYSDGGNHVEHSKPAKAKKTK